MIHYSSFEKQFLEASQTVCAQNPDPSHDILHVQRVVKTAKQLALAEKANLNIVVPAAYLHDFEFISKTDSRRAMASRLSAEKAQKWLHEIAYPEEFIADIAHAIEAHSFSAGITARTLEAKIVQDADRLDGLGAIGIARCFGLSGLLRRKFYNPDDPTCVARTPNDSDNSLDHFFVKLFKIAETLHTPSAQQEGQQRVNFMKSFVRQLEHEIT